MDDNVKAGIETAIGKVQEAKSAASDALEEARQAMASAENAWDAADDAERELNALF